MLAGDALAPARHLGVNLHQQQRRCVVVPKLVWNGSTSGMRISRSRIASILIKPHS